MNKRQATGGSAMGGGGSARAKSAKQYSTGGQMSAVSKSSTMKPINKQNCPKGGC